MERDEMALEARDDLEDMLARVALADREAFSRLYDATAAKLLAVCLRVLKERASAEEAMQDAFIKIWHNAGRYRVTGHSPMTWLITIARNTAIDRLRAARPAEDVDAMRDVLADKRATPEQSAVAGSEASRVRACLDELEDDRRAAIGGAYLDGESYADLARRFDVPLNTMRTWLRRGLIALRECMDR
jgi:RNA polymerase sigma-70 factor (ECF subfamily)